MKHTPAGFGGRICYQLIFVKAIAIISLLAWTGIVICGRFIAYT
ncbi:hypothetical protein [Chroococcidiopsis sp. SAG 2025]|nr:hypothetical protein [Chroococcidiopsis sp. SAG 2025]